MVAVRPTFHHPALLAKQAANIDHIGGGRLSLNVVSSWWADEATQYGVALRPARRPLRPHRRVARVVDGAVDARPASATRASTTRWRTRSASRSRSRARGRRSTPAASPRRRRTLIASQCDAYVMHGDPPERDRAEDRRHAAPARGSSALPPMQLRRGRLRDRARHARPRRRRELARITDVQPSRRRATTTISSGSPARSSSSELSLEDYSVSNRGLRAGLVGTPEQVRRADRGVRGGGRGPAAAAVQPAVRGDGALRRRR